MRAIKQDIADLEDILQALTKLDEAKKIPQIYCEVTKLVKLPPIIVDPGANFNLTLAYISEHTLVFFFREHYISK